MTILSAFNRILYSTNATVLKNCNVVLSKSHGSRAASTKVGFIGLGNMGGPMAKNLIKKGHSLVVFDPMPEAIDSVVKSGATAGKSAADVASQASCIVTMLPNNDIVTNVYNGDDGILKNVQKGSLLLDCSTVDPSVPINLSEKAKNMGLLFIDAPVSGGVPAAVSGELTFMVGGDAAIFEKAKDVLSGMGRRLVHCGGPGMGQAAKICNNMLLGISMAGVSECFNLGMRLGLDPKTLMDIVNVSTGRCWSSEMYNPVPGLMPNVPSSKNYEGGFATGLMTKDLGLAQAAAIRSVTPIPLGAAVHQIYRIMCSSGYAGKDFASIFQFLQEKNNK